MIIQNNYPFRNLSLGFILKIFLKFCKFQSRYSYKIYSYRKKECISVIQLKHKVLIMKSYFYFQFQVLSVSVVRLSYEYSNMTLKSPTYCDRTSCVYVVIFFFANPTRNPYRILTRKSNSKNQLKIFPRQ